MSSKNHKLYFSANKLTNSDDDFNVYCSENYNEMACVAEEYLINIQKLKDKETLKALSTNQLKIILESIQQALKEKLITRN